MLVVLARLANPIAPRLTTPPRESETAKPNPGAGGTPESAASSPDWPNTHRVSGERSYSASTLAAFAARAETSTPEPTRSGTSITIGLVLPSAPNRQPFSAITKELV